MKLYRIDKYLGLADKDAMKDYKVSFKVLSGNFVEGKINGYIFQAQIFSKSSKYGLYNGRISRLNILKGKKILYHYDRGIVSGTKTGIKLSRQLLKVFPRRGG